MYGIDNSSSNYKSEYESLLCFVTHLYRNGFDENATCQMLNVIYLVNKKLIKWILR